MFQEDVQAGVAAALKKLHLLHNRPAAYFVSSALAGMFVGFGVLLAFTIGGLLQGFAGTKIIMGLSFGIALSLVVMAGSELFTGNNLIMALGIFQKKVTVRDAALLWGFCWLGNLVGSAITAVLFSFSGLCTGPVAQFIAQSAATKMSLPISELIIRGIFCNILVCLAVWCSTRLKSESGKLIMIFWCLFAFITTGFEHSVANMTLLVIALIHPMEQAVSIGGYFYNLFFVTLGNMLGGILFVALPYAFIAGRGESQQ